MNGRQFSFGTSGNPLLQVLSLLVFGVLLVGAVIMGAVVLTVLLGVAVIAGLVFSVRLWWVRRKLRARGPYDGGPQPPRSGSDAHLIEGEYEVIESDAEAAERRRQR